MRAVSLMKRAGGRVVAALALGLALGLATGAQAEGNQGKWYVGLNIPVMFIDETETDVNGTSLGPNPIPGGTPANIPIPYSADSVLSYGLGFRLGGTVGYYVLPNLRIEGELFYGFARVRKNRLDNVRVADNPIPIRTTVPIKGNTKMFGAMANAWYDIDTGSDWIPFVGGGIGFIQVDLGDLKYDQDALPKAIAAATGQPAPPPGFTPRTSDRDTVFAFQVGGGVGYRMSETTTAHFSYKYFLASGLEYDGRNAFNNSISTKSDMQIHLFEVGFRYHF